MNGYRNCGTYVQWNITAIKENTSESVLMRQMNLEPIVQSELSQKEKDKYCILMLVYEIQKDGTDDPVFWAGRESQT